MALNGLRVWLIILIPFFIFSAEKVTLSLCLALGGFISCFILESLWLDRKRDSPLDKQTIAYLFALLGYGTGAFFVVVFTGIGVLFNDKQPPYHTEQIGNDFLCEETYWGGAGAEGGFTVSLYKVKKEDPSFKKEVRSSMICQTCKEQAETKETSCEAIFTAYKAATP